MNVIIREAAYDDLENIFAYIAKDNITAGRMVVARIVDAMERLVWSVTGIVFIVRITQMLGEIPDTSNTSS